ncbi:MAG TPA: TIGR03936 family radical SAM-associated protein, partial [Spirochaetota bacterium]|nr:TIGR03936 family radical SAM-associated protein [Spirochaetota bacterium]
TFQKRDTAKYFSHNDMLDHIRRAFTSASFPVSYTQGFNKHEKISASFPIPLGIESECELIDAEVYTSFDCDEMKKVINESLPAGLSLLSITQTAKSNLMRIGASSVYVIKGADNEKMKTYLESDSVYLKESKGKVREILVKEAVLNYEFCDDKAKVEILCGSIRIDDFIRMFGEDGVVNCVKIKQNL